METSIKVYQVVQTSGRSTNNTYVRDNEGPLTSSHSGSFFVGARTDLALPERVPAKHIFVERFSAPGGPEIMSRGYLDAEAEEKSVHNALPWRNLTVRKPLQTLLSRHSAQGGLDSVYGSPSASYHKTPRNSRSAPISASAGDTWEDGSKHDNWYVQHAIPVSDLQYTWIATSQTGTILRGYEQPDHANHGLASTSITFLSQSNFGSFLEVVGTASIGNAPHARNFGATQESGALGWMPTDFVGLNYNIVEPISASSNTLGWPVGTPILDQPFNNWPPQWVSSSGEIEMRFDTDGRKEDALFTYIRRARPKC